MQTSEPRHTILHQCRACRLAEVRPAGSIPRNHRSRPHQVCHVKGHEHLCTIGTRIDRTRRTSPPHHERHCTTLSNLIPSQSTLNQSSSTATSPTSSAHLVSLLSNPDVGESSHRSVVQSMILHKLSSLVLIPAEKLMTELGRPLSELGMDSIIGAEFRTWAWRELRAELTFVQVLEGGGSLGWLVETVWGCVAWVELK